MRCFIRGRARRRGYAFHCVRQMSDYVASATCPEAFCSISKSLDLKARINDLNANVFCFQKDAGMERPTQSLESQGTLTQGLELQVHALKGTLSARETDHDRARGASERAEAIEGDLRAEVDLLRKCLEEEKARHRWS